MTMVPSLKILSLSFNFSFYFKILVIVVGEKWVPCPIRVGEKWLPIQNLTVRSGYRRVLVRWPLLTAKFWSGTHFWQPSFGQVTFSHRHILDRVPIFHRRLLRECWKKAKIEAIGKVFEAWDHAHHFSGHFLRHICQDSSYWQHPFN